MEVNGLHRLNYGHIPGTNDLATGQEIGRNNQNFSDVLKGQLERDNALNFSKHAVKRLDERGVALDNQLLNNLEQAVEEARSKGARDVAVIGSQGVFIVNVTNNVVVTTITQEDMKNRIFTNIDSAVLM